MHNINKDAIEKLNIIVPEILNGDYKYDPDIYIEELAKLFKRYFVGKSVYTYLKDHNDSKFVRTIKSTNILFQELYECIYQGKRVKFSKFDYMLDITPNMNITGNIKFTIDFKPQYQVAEINMDFVNLLSTIGIQETAILVKYLYTKVYITKVS